MATPGAGATAADAAASEPEAASASAAASAAGVGAVGATVSATAAPTATGTAGGACGGLSDLCSAADLALMDLRDSAAHTRESAIGALSRICARAAKHAPARDDAANERAGENEDVLLFFPFLQQRLLEMLSEPGGEGEGRKYVEDTAEGEDEGSHGDEGKSGGAKGEGRSKESDRAAGGKQSPWEYRHGGFIGAKVALEHWASQQASDFCIDLSRLCVNHLDDDEPRVRLAVAEAVWGVALRGDADIISSLAQSILSHIHAALEEQQHRQQQQQQAGAAAEEEAREVGDSGGWVIPAAVVAAASATAAAEGEAGTSHHNHQHQHHQHQHEHHQHHHHHHHDQNSQHGGRCTAGHHHHSHEDHQQDAGHHRHHHHHPHHHHHSHEHGSAPDEGRRGACEDEGSKDASEGGGGSGEEALSPRSDSAGLQAAMRFAGGPAAVVGSGAGAAGAPLKGFSSRGDVAARGNGRSLETALRSLQRLLEGLVLRASPLASKTPVAGAAVPAAGAAAAPAAVAEGSKVGSKEEGDSSLGRQLALLVLPTLLRTAGNRNRFAREASFFAMSALFPLLSPSEDVGSQAQETALVLAGGLSDNWSQVRYASSIAVRPFMVLLGQRRHEFYSVLLPAMVFNRYYGAEGVRVFSQATWQQVMGMSGRGEVAKHIDHVVELYLSQATASNFMARETACFCIGELAGKIERKALEPHVPRLLQVVRCCHSDLIWPVRVAACAASARLVSEYPTLVDAQWGDMVPAWTANLADRMAAVRRDAAGVFGAALAAKAPRALPCVLELLGRMLLRAKEQQPTPAPQQAIADPHVGGPGGGRGGGSPGGLRVMRVDLVKPLADGQAAGSSTEAPQFAISYTTIKAPKNVPVASVSATAAAPAPTTAAVAASAAGDTAEREGSSQSISTAGPHGAVSAETPLTPQSAAAATPAAAGGATATVQATTSAAASALAASGCPHCRQHGSGNGSNGISSSNGSGGGAAAGPTAWEQSEGAVYLLQELAAVAPDEAAKFMPTLAELATHCGSAADAYGSLVAVLYLQLPRIAKAMGKRKFKSFLESFLPPLFASLSSRTQVEAASAAGQSLLELQMFVGPAIFEGRLTPPQRQAMAALRERKAQLAGASPSAAPLRPGAGGAYVGGIGGGGGGGSSWGGVYGGPGAHTTSLGLGSRGQMGASVGHVVPHEPPTRPHSGDLKKIIQDCFGEAS